MKTNHATSGILAALGFLTMALPAQAQVSLPKVVRQWRFNVPGNTQGWTEQSKESSQEYFWKTEMGNRKIPVRYESSSHAKRQIEIGIVLDPDLPIRHADYSRNEKKEQYPCGSVLPPDRE